MQIIENMEKFLVACNSATDTDTGRVTVTDAGDQETRAARRTLTALCLKFMLIACFTFNFALKIVAMLS